MDITSISAALGSIKTASDIAKLIKDSGNNLEQAEIKLKIADLVGALADAKLEIADIQNQLIDKGEQIKYLKAQLNFKSSLTYEKPYYFLIEDEGKDGPYCQACYDKEKSLIRLQELSIGNWKCMVCEKGFLDENYVFPSLL